MYCGFLFLSFAVFIGRAQSAAIGIQLPKEKPFDMAHLNGCYVPEVNRVLPYNKPYSPQDGKNCLQYNCQNDNITTIIGCGAFMVGKDCEIIIGDKTLPYPDCCERPTCDDYIIH